MLTETTRLTNQPMHQTGSSTWETTTALRKRMTQEIQAMLDDAAILAWVNAIDPIVALRV